MEKEHYSTVVIVEDEEPAALRLQKMLAQADPSLIVVQRLDSVEAAVKWFAKNPSPALVFLDIQLADGLSFDIFKLVQIDSFVIFTTAYDEYAIKAFELNSVDYLLKPIKQDKLEQAISKYRKLAFNENPSSLAALISQFGSQAKQYKKRFMISLGSRIAAIETSEIAYFYTLEKSTFLCTNEGKNYPIDFSLEKLEELLNPDDFFRINRQMTLSFRAIEKIHIMSKSRIKLDVHPAFTEEVWVSSHKSSQFRQWLDK